MLLRSCLDYLNLHMEDKNMHCQAVLVGIFRHLLDKPNFSTVFSLSLTSGTINEGFLENLSGVLHLSLSEKISIGLALSDSDNLDTKKCGKFSCLLRFRHVAILLLKI